MAEPAQRCRTVVKAVRAQDWDESARLATNVIRTVGWRVLCERCGPVGRERDKRQALELAERHELEAG